MQYLLAFVLSEVLNPTMLLGSFIKPLQLLCLSLKLLQERSKPGQEPGIMIAKALR